jgi:hypothetical protein
MGSLMRAVLVLSVVAIWSCTHVAERGGPGPAKITEIDTKSYVLSALVIAPVGEPVIRRKQYSVLERDGFLQATNDFLISGGISSASVSVVGQRGVPYPIVGSIDAQGTQVNAIQIPGSQFVFGILPDGRFSGVAAAFSYLSAPVRGVNVYRIGPGTTLFVPATQSQVLGSRPYKNHEIIYSGLSRDDFKLLYREYSVSDLIRPAFSQELTYPRDSTSIRFREYRIDVMRVTPEGITFKVVAD